MAKGFVGFTWSRQPTRYGGSEPLLTLSSPCLSRDFWITLFLSQAGSVGFHDPAHDIRRAIDLTLERIQPRVKARLTRVASLMDSERRLSLGKLFLSTAQLGEDGDAAHGYAAHHQLAGEPQESAPLRHTGAA